MLVEKFCGCGKLETGGMVVGIIGLIGNSFLIYLFLPIMLKGSSMALDPLIVVVGFIFVLSIFGMIIGSISLIIGTKKRDPNLVFIWLVFAMIAFIASCLTYIVDFRISTMWFPALQIYWFICILAFFKKLTGEKLEPPARAQPEQSPPNLDV